MGHAHLRGCRSLNEDAVAHSRAAVVEVDAEKLVHGEFALFIEVDVRDVKSAGKSGVAEESAHDVGGSKLEDLSFPRLV